MCLGKQLAFEKTSKTKNLGIFYDGHLGFKINGRIQISKIPGFIQGLLSLQI